MAVSRLPTRPSPAPADLPPSFDLPPARHGTRPAPGPSDPAERLALFDALSPFVTDLVGPRSTPAPVDDEADPFQALVADIAIERSRAPAGSDGYRRGLLRAVAELAETHAVAADLAAEKTAIDLPLDVPTTAPNPRFPRPVAPDSPRRDSPLLVVPDMIRACRDRLARHASEDDRVKMDVVATLFDHVLSDDRIATDLRNVLARLQLPVLRMALADDTFFASRMHPTRRLLHRLASAAAVWRDEAPSSRAGIAAIERVVHTAIRGSFEDAGQHARLLDEFERAVADVEMAASIVQPAEPVLDSEDRDVLVIKATIQISQLLAGVDVDREVRFFLLDVWSRVLVEIACLPSDSGRDALLARAKRLCFDLAWAAAPKTTSGERARLAGLLPTMIAAIRDGLKVIGYPPADERRFFAEFTRVLLQAVRGAPGAPFRYEDKGIDGLTIDAFAQRLREGSFGPETMLGAAVAAPPSLGLRTANDATPSMLREAAERDARDGATRPAAATLAPIVVAQLAKGEWFEMRIGDVFMRVRLSWVSPLRSFYLFIGADSALTRSLDPAAVDALVASGDLRRASGRRDD